MAVWMLSISSSMLHHCVHDLADVLQIAAGEHHTLFLENDPDAGTCVLLSSLQEPIQRCDTCITGPKDCHSSGHNRECGFWINNSSEMVTSVKFDQPGHNQVHIPLTFGVQCQLRAFLVGGGGSMSGDAGGGSGYLKYYSELTGPPITIELLVGGSQQASFVQLENGTRIIAEAGKDGMGWVEDGYKGGDGYSGGGCRGHCYGGSNGSDGQGDDHGEGGSGSQVDLTSFPLDNFVLSPGPGGKWCEWNIWGSPGGVKGGGGGGIIVNGEVSGKQGYGGGGGGGEGIYCGGGGANGGIILVEIISVVDY